VVGRDSLAVDSAGAAMISIAWEEWKGIQVWMSGLDVRDDMYAPTVPFVMRRFTEAYEGLWEDYYKDASVGDERTEFKDDWSQPPFDQLFEQYHYTGFFGPVYPYAVSSSNIITVGGPLANLASWYYNDFTDALVFTNIEAGFFSASCWAHTAFPTVESKTIWGLDGDKWPEWELWYNSTTVDDDVGHAIISTYKDKNETVGFIVYGYTAEDTYYASYILRGGLLLWLQEIQDGSTTLIVEFDYDNTYPTTENDADDYIHGIHPIGVHIAEVLGKFTECTGFDTNFKTHQYYVNKAAAQSRVEARADSYGLCYKLVDICWCAQVHPDP
jgi:hypothetical protein